MSEDKTLFSAENKGVINKKRTINNSPFCFMNL